MSQDASYKSRSSDISQLSYESGDFESQSLTQNSSPRAAADGSESETGSNSDPSSPARNPVRADSHKKQGPISDNHRETKGGGSDHGESWRSEQSDSPQRSTPQKRERKLKNENMGNSNSNNDKVPRQSYGYRSSWSTRDTNEYLAGYPDKKDNSSMNKNLHFYLNRIPSYPDGDYIDNIHKKWYGDYERLERHHGYIQWLFPIRESGMNFQAQELQLHEAEAIVTDPEATKRVLKSYKMMLDFYGMKLEKKSYKMILDFYRMKSEKGKTGDIVSKMMFAFYEKKVNKGQTGERYVVCKAENWQERFKHLNRSFHNYLRITRILKCLGELGHEDLKFPFCAFVLRQALESKTLSNCTESCVNYWIRTLRVEEERNTLIKLEEESQYK